MPAIRAIIVDDHQVIRDGLRMMLSTWDELAIVAEAKDATEALSRVEQFAPEVVLVDIQLPGMNGLRLLRVMKERFPSVKVLILTNYANEEFLVEAFRSGADGYLLKNISRNELIESIRSVLTAGTRVLAPELVAPVLDRFGEEVRRSSWERFGLTGTEVELLKLVARGATNRDIAECMYLSPTTVKRRLSDVFRKLNALDRAHAVALATQHGLI